MRRRGDWTRPIARFVQVGNRYFNVHAVGSIVPVFGHDLDDVDVIAANIHGILEVEVEAFGQRNLASGATNGKNAGVNAVQQVDNRVAVIFSCNVWRAQGISAGRAFDNAEFGGENLTIELGGHIGVDPGIRLCLEGPLSRAFGVGCPHLNFIIAAPDQLVDYAHADGWAKAGNACRIGLANSVLDVVSGYCGAGIGRRIPGYGDLFVCADRRGPGHLVGRFVYVGYLDGDGDAGRAIMTVVYGDHYFVCVLGLEV